MFQPSKENLAFLQGFLASVLQVCEIADYLECSRKTVSRWKAKFLEYPQNYLIDARIFNGSPQPLTVEEIENIRLLSEFDPFMPATKIKEDLMLNCHVKAVRKVMREHLDLYCFTPATKNKLIHLDKQRRI